MTKVYLHMAAFWLGLVLILGYPLFIPTISENSVVDGFYSALVLGCMCAGAIGILGYYTAQIAAVWQWRRGQYTPYARTHPPPPLPPYPTTSPTTATNPTKPTHPPDTLWWQP